jgi:hypothetical protein
MTVTRLIASGNWSNAAIFLGGVKPPAGATVAANGFTATIDESISIGGQYCPQVAATATVTGAWYMIESVGNTNFISIGAASNTAGIRFQATGTGTGTGLLRAVGTLTTAVVAGSSAGGGFTTSGSHVIAADIRSGTTPCLTITGTGSPTLDGTGQFSNILIRALYIPSSTAGAHAITHTGSGLLTLQTAAGTNAPAANIHGLVNSGGGSILVIGGTHTTASNTISNVIQMSNGSITVQDNANINSTGSAANSPVVLNITASASLVINNSVITGGGSASPAIAVAGSISGSGNTFAGGYGLTVSGTPSVNLTNNLYSASALGPAIYSILTTATLTITGTETDHSSGFSAVVALRRNYGNATATGSYREGKLSSGSAFILGDALYSLFDQPAIGDVRSGVTYANGQLVGTLQSTSPTPQQIWEYASRTLTDRTGFELTSNERIAISDRIERVGGMLDLKLLTSAYTTPPTVTAISDRIERAGGMLDLKLSTSSYTAPPSASTIATAVENAILDDNDGRAVLAAISTTVQQGILNENDGQAILNAIVGAIGNQNVDQIALVAAIRSDLERAGGVLSTRSNLTSADIIQAVWIDALNRTLTDRTGFSLTTAEREAISARLEREGGPIALVSAFIAQLNSTRLTNVATTEAIAQLLASALCAL